MSIWSRISDAVSALQTKGDFSAIFEGFKQPPEKTIGFTIAIIALGAKMAKADGHVTTNEVSVFREIFHIPQSAEADAAKVFNMARQDTAGYKTYARQIKNMFIDQEKTLHDLMEGLFHISMADGYYHPKEDDFLHTVADIFGISEGDFRSMRMRFVPNMAADAYDILGVDTATPFLQIKSKWQKLVRETHPDQMVARGIPEEAIKLSEKRLIAINTAWETIQNKHG